MNENAYYDIVAQELQAQTMVPGLWTRAFSESGGQLDRARALYIKHRVAQLTQEANEKLQRERRAAAAAAKKRTLDGLRRFFLVILSIALGLFAFLLFVAGIGMQFDTRPEPIGSTITCIIMAVVFGFFTYLSAKAATR